MGLCTSREVKISLDGVPPEELIVFQSECKLMLNEVIYERFRGAVKRYGFAGDLTERHMIEISNEIKCDTKAMVNDDTSPFSVVYLDKEFRS